MGSRHQYRIFKLAYWLHLIGRSGGPMNVMKAVSKRKVLTMGVFLISVVAFQNCSQTNFASDEAVFASKSIDDSEVTTQVEDNDPQEAPPKGEGCEKESKNIALVECELGVASSKIVMDKVFKVGSNNSSSRVCMSQKACLEIINAYAGPRNCSLKPGDESGPMTGASCTKVFPGSKGTCKNVLVLSDAQVVEVLSAMANQ